MLIVAQSARALAGSARRAGYRPLVADLFCDLDTREAADACVQVGSALRGLGPPHLLAAALDELARERMPIGLVYGSGFEDRPAVLNIISEKHVLLGNSPTTVSATKDPLGFASLCQAHGVPHPETAMRPGREDWLVKRIGGSGGTHISRDRQSQRLKQYHYAQRCVAGRPVSALFLGDGSACQVLGFSEQWSDPLPLRPYRYGGAMRPALLSDGSAEAMIDAVARLVPALGLRGLNSADFMLRDDGFDLIEINPRPGATMDVYPDFKGELFTQHVQACCGCLPGFVAAAEGAAAAVVYAPKALTLAAGFVWPDWAADRQPSARRVPKGAPLCTVRAEATDATRARALVAERTRLILQRAAVS